MSDGRATSDRLRAAVLSAVAIGLIWYSLQLTTTQLDPAPGAPYARSLTHAKDDVRVQILMRGDGQFFAALATDPTMARPEALRAPPAEYAYRWMRPLLGWLGWIWSAGHPDAVPLALIVLTVLSLGVLVGGSGLIATVLGRDAVGALGCLALPGTLVVLEWTGPEALAAGLGLAGCALVLRDRGVTWASALLLTAGVLARETSLFLCLGLALWLWRIAGRRASAIVVAAVPTVVLGAWLLIVRLRVDASMFDRRSGRLSLPFAGMIDAAPHWTPDSIFMLSVIVGLCAVAVVRAGDDRQVVLLLAAPSLVFATVLGSDVWARWQDVGRVALPLTVLALVACLPRAQAPKARFAP
jgi:hypothetical protein